MKLLAQKYRFFKTDRGVTMVEFALVLPLLMILVIGIIDVSRYFAYQAVLNKGAESGLNLALKVPNLDVDLNQYQPGDVDYQRYQQARDLVSQKAVEIPLKTFFSDSSTDSIAKLVTYTYQDPDIGSGTVVSKVEDAGLIFPGETLIANEGSPHQIEVHHKTFPNPPTAQTKEDLLKQHPVIVELRAEVQPLTPFIQPLTMRATAMGYREAIPRGPLTGEFGLVDPEPESSSSSSGGSSSSSSVANLPLPEPGVAAVLNWAICGGTVGKPCPNANSDFAVFQCKECNSANDPGLEKLGF